MVGRLQPDDGSITRAEPPLAAEVLLQARVLDLRARALRAKKQCEQATMPSRDLHARFRGTPVLYRDP